MFRILVIAWGSMLFLAVILISRPDKDDKDESYSAKERYSVIRDHLQSFGSVNGRDVSHTEAQIENDITDAFGS